MGEHKGFVGFGIRELSNVENASYCNAINTTVLPMPSDLVANLTFNADFSVRVFSSACYYYDTKTNSWRTNGMQLMADSTIEQTHCITDHLTEFASGFIILPVDINFNYVWANADITRNPIIYTTVIALTCIFIVGAILARFMDKRDSARIGVCALSDNLPGDNYLYEVVMFTGSRREAATDSKVFIVIVGEENETNVRCLEDPTRKPFRRGGVDSFILAVAAPLKNIRFIKIWHDNSGRREMASWFLEHCILHDLQTRETLLFQHENWLAVDKGDGVIERVLHLSNEAERADLTYRLVKQGAQSLSDKHLWYSVATRPTQSTFTRLDRLTCCFVLLYVTMLINILYYGLDTSPSANMADGGGLQIGPFNFTTRQVGFSKFLYFISNPVMLNGF